ncbi:MAG: BPS1 family protein [Flavobacterium sp. JAD_PAG50586_2]|nr:MAG: BPS1 family protein [Flavobacterium sp. JAD_PAG50586_2]
MTHLEKKYLKTRKDDPPKLGNFLQWHIEQSTVKKKDVAAYLDVIPQTLTQYFKQRGLQTIILWRISRVINYNLLMDLGQRLKIPFETEAEKELRVQLAEKEELIKKMEIQLEVFREMK